MEVAELVNSSNSNYVRDASSVFVQFWCESHHKRHDLYISHSRYLWKSYELAAIGEKCERNSHKTSEIRAETACDGRNAPAAWGCERKFPNENPRTSRGARVEEEP